jgi:hypothetical protein
MFPRRWRHHKCDISFVIRTCYICQCAPVWVFWFQVTQQLDQPLPGWEPLSNAC